LFVIFKIDTRFSAKSLEPLQKSKIAVISIARATSALNPAQLIKVMQFLYGRHPEIRMGIKLLIEPGGSGFVRSDAQKIRACVASNGLTLFLPPVVTGAASEWPSPPHFSLFSFWTRKSKSEQVIFESKEAGTLRDQL